MQDEGRTRTGMVVSRRAVLGGVVAALAAQTVFLDSAAPAHASVAVGDGPADLPFGRSRHTTTRLGDGRVLVAGGLGQRPLSDVLILSKGIWSPAAPLIVARYDHAAVLLPDGRVAVLGGTGASTFSLSEVEVYDPGSNLWSLAPPLALARSQHSATVAAGGILCIGGVALAALASVVTTGSPPLSDVELYAI